jgi:hypothetical protein
VAIFKYWSTYLWKKCSAIDKKIPTCVRQTLEKAFELLPEEEEEEGGEVEGGGGGGEEGGPVLASVTDPGWPKFILAYFITAIRAIVCR